MAGSRALCVALVLSAVSLSSVFAQFGPVQELDATALHLKTGKVGLVPSTSWHRKAGGALTKSTRAVIQLDGALTPERIARLQQAGVKLGQYLPANAYVVRLDAGFNAAARLADIPFVRWVGPFDKKWKIDTTIGKRTFLTAERQALQMQSTLKLTVALFEGEDVQAAANRIAAMPGAVVFDVSLSGDEGMLELTIPKEVVDQLASDEAVQWVEEAAEGALRNSTNKWILQSNSAAQAPVWNNGITGQGQIAGHIDGLGSNGLNFDHCAFRDAAVATPGPTHRKIIAYFGGTSDDTHATHTAGTFFGDSFPIDGSTTNRGMAYSAKAAFTNWGTITSSNLYSKFVQNHNAGARVHSNSWGDDSTTNYIAWTRDTDRFSYDNEDDLVCFAVTNQANVMRTPENAKNCLAVNRGDDTPNQGNECLISGQQAAAGPTQDGRRKPDVIVPGCSTVSSSSTGTSCTFSGTGWSGTSMACPAAAGCGILVRQYFMDGFYPTGAAVPANAFTPTGALIKAVLINSSVDMSGIAGYPSNKEGWGRVLLDNALYFAGDTSKLIVLKDRRNAVGLTTGQSETFNLNVVSIATPFRITLVWTEKEAALNANPAYINNLNLVVTGPGGTYLGNVFSGGQSTPGGATDTKNNVEQVQLTVPTAGAYTVQVLASTVNTVDPQGFALVASGNINLTLPAPTVVSITPDTAEAESVVAITNLAGTNFQVSGTTTVKLSRIGFPDIVATGVSVLNSTQITCNFNLAGAEVGLYDVVVTNPDLQTATLAGGFDVTVTCLKGDVNLDGLVDGLDVQAFVDILMGGGSTAVTRCAGDIEPARDNQLSDDDTLYFIDCLLNSGCP